MTNALEWLQNKYKNLHKYNATSLAAMAKDMDDYAAEKNLILIDECDSLQREVSQLETSQASLMFELGGLVMEKQKAYQAGATEGHDAAAESIELYQKQAIRLEKENKVLLDEMSLCSGTCCKAAKAKKLLAAYMKEHYHE